jgi:hypothetical protein
VLWQSQLLTRYKEFNIGCRYEVLSDPRTRAAYDARGEAGLSEQGSMDPQVSLPPTFHNNYSYVDILGPVQSAFRWWCIWRKLLLRWSTRWKKKDQRPRPPCSRHSRGALQGKNNKIGPDAKRTLLQVQREGWKGWRSSDLRKL